MVQSLRPSSLPSRREGKGRPCLTACPWSIQHSRAWTHVSTDVHAPNTKLGAMAGTWSRLAPTPGCVLVAGQHLGLWPGMVVPVVVVVLVLVALSAGILWFVLSR